MTSLKTLISATALGVALAAVPAQAVVTTFATFSASGPGANVRLVNSGTSTATTRATLYTTATPSGGVQASRNVVFSFLQSGFGGVVTNVTASWNLLAATTPGTVAELNAGNYTQASFAGSMSFLSTQDITVNDTFFAAGSNLLTVAFTDAAITGRQLGSSGALAGSTTGGANILYTSDFLDFSLVQNSDFALNLTSIQSVLFAVSSAGTPVRALRSFRAVAGGSFASDPAPIIPSVPEPEMWGLMVVGFGMVGVQVRRRSRARGAIAA